MNAPFRSTSNAGGIVTHADEHVQRSSYDQHDNSQRCIGIIFGLCLKRSMDRLPLLVS